MKDFLFTKMSVTLASVGLIVSLGLVSCSGGSKEAAAPAATTSTTASADASGVDGAKVYAGTCIACHQATGLGMPNLFPPLAGSDYLKDKNKTITSVIKGLTGPVTVNGTTFNGVMPPSTLKDEEIAAALTYVYASWGNDGTKVTAAEVAALR